MDEAPELSGSISESPFLCAPFSPHLWLDYLYSGLFRNCNLPWLTKWTLIAAVLQSSSLSGNSPPPLQGTAAWTASIIPAAKYHLLCWSMHRAGWKAAAAAANTASTWERGGGGPGGTLLLLTEQARRCSLLISSMQSTREVVGRCWLCPLNTVTAVRPYHAISRHKKNESADGVALLQFT